MRLIDADELLTAFPCGETVRTECVRATIKHMPTIEERKTGKWIPGREVSRTFVGPNNVRIDYEDWRCSVCGCVVEQWWKPEYNFCQNCGADMKGEEHGVFK